MGNKQKKSPFSGSLATDENGLGLESLQNRLERYGAGKTRALGMADYIMQNEVGNNGAGRPTILQARARRIAGKMQRCGSYWYMERLQVVLAQNPRLRAFMVTLTV